MGKIAEKAALKKIPSLILSWGLYLSSPSFWPCTCDVFKMYNNHQTTKTTITTTTVHFQVNGIHPLINNRPIAKRYGFKPFFLPKVGVYEVKFSVFLGNTSCNVERILNITMSPNVANVCILFKSLFKF